MSDRLQQLASGEAEAKRGLEGWVAGRSRRREYWLWVIPTLAAGVALDLAGAPRLLIAVLNLPYLFAEIRRLHDLGLSGWLAPLINVASNVLKFALVAMLGTDNGDLIGSLVQAAVLIALGCIPGTPGDNAFGPPPGRRQRSNLEETFG